MNRKQELYKNAFVTSIGKMSTLFVYFLLLPVYTTVLRPSDYGLIDLSLTYVTLLAPLLSAQIEMATFRYLVESRGSKLQSQKVITNTLELILFAVVGLTAVGCTMTFTSLPTIIPLVIINIIFSIVLNTLQQIARGLGNNKKFAIGSTITSIAAVIFTMILIVLMGFGAYGMITALSLAYIIGVTYFLFKLQILSYINVSLSSWQFKKELLLYSLPLVPNGISWWAVNVFDRTLVSGMLGIAANGIYAVSNKFPAVFNTMLTLFNMSWTESTSLHIKSKDKDQFFSETISDSLRLFASIGGIIIAATGLIFPWVINSRYHEARIFIPILIVASLFNVAVTLYSGIYIALKQTKEIMKVSIFAAVINTVLNLIFLRKYGLYAASFSTLVAYAVMAVERHRHIRRHIKIHYEKRLWLDLALLYTIPVGLYYLNIPIINALNVVITITLVIVINRKAIMALRAFLVNKRRNSKLDGIA